MVIRTEIRTDRTEEVLSSLLSKKLENNQIDSESSPSTRTIQPAHQKWYNCSCASVYLVVGIFLISTGILTTIFPITEYVMNERLKMTPGLPAFQLWYRTDPEIILNVYLFNVTNSEEFEAGIDEKMKIVEIGPIVYQEILINSDVVFHEENSTMSYTVTRSAQFLPDRNQPGILNQTIIVPNIPLIAMAAYLQNYMMTVKFGFRMMSSKDSLFLHTPIDKYLWNFTTPALKAASSYVPFMVPTNNSGPLATVYKDFSDRVNVNIGKGHKNEDFFKINTFGYSAAAPGYNYQRGDCFASLKNSSEGAIYGQYMTRNSSIYYWRKTVCRPIPLYYEEDVQVGNMLGYKFVTKSNMYDRVQAPEVDCYASFNNFEYPDGLSDASKCYSDLSVAISLPHFYDRKGFWDNKIEGFRPSKEQHLSYAIVEPVTGIPLQQCARSQSNLLIPKLTGFSAKISKFSDMVVPLMWLEYRLDKLTPTIDMILYVLVNLLPVGQYFISVGLLLIGVCFVMLYKCTKSRSRSTFNYLSSAQISSSTFESDVKATPI